MPSFIARLAHSELHFIAVVWHIAMPALIETAKIAAVLTVAMSIALAYPRTRRVAMATLAFVKRHAPRWAIPLIIAAAIFPGQADEMVVIPIILLPILLNARKRHLFTRYIRYSWKG